MSAHTPRLPRPWPDLAAITGLTLAAAIAASALANLPPPRLALGTIAILAALAALTLAIRRPGWLLGLLLALVLLQDPLVAAGLAPLQMADEALVLLGALGLGLRAWRAGRMARTPLDLPSVAFVLVAIVAAAARQVPPWVAFLGILSVAKGLLAFHLAARLPGPRRALRRGLPPLLSLAALTAALALLQRVGGPAVYAAQGRIDYYTQWQGTKAPSLYFNHNALGHVMVLFGAAALALALAAPAWLPRRRAAALAVLLLGGLVVSASRESWLAAVAALLALALVVRTRRTSALALALSALLAAGGVAVYSGSPLLREEIARRTAGVWDGWRVYRMGYTGWAYRGEYRVYNVLKSWEVFLDHPVLGTGPGRFGGATAVRHLSPLYAEVDFLPLNGAYIPLDVFWSRLLAEFGLAGSAAFLAALAAYARVARRAARARADAERRAVGLAGVMAWAAILVLACLSPAFEDPLAAMPFWALGGLAWAVDRSAGPGRDP